MNKLQFIKGEIKKRRMRYISFSIITYPLSKTFLKYWRLKIKDLILVKSLTKKIKKDYDLNFINVYSKFYCEALKEIYEQKIYDFFPIKKRDVVYDVGAGCGEYSLLCAKEEADVLAFEMREDAYDIMNGNIKLNNFKDKIKTYCEKIDDKNTLDFYCNKTNKIPTIIKIDVEGDEFKALIGGRNTLKKYHPKIILETHSPQLRTDCLNFLFKLNYKIKLERVEKKTNLLFLETVK